MHKQIEAYGLILDILRFGPRQRWVIIVEVVKNLSLFLLEIVLQFKFLYSTKHLSYWLQR